MNDQFTPRRKRPRTLRSIGVGTLFALCAGVAGLVAGASGASAVRGGAQGNPHGTPLATAAPVDVSGLVGGVPAFDGTFTVEKFRGHKGTLYAVGQLEGQMGGQAVNKKVSWPVKSATAGPATTTATGEMHGFQVPVPTPGACDILTLGLGPLDLDLLGLRVALSPVDLLIEAIPGPGNLLGNLLCGVAGLLDGGLGGGLGGLLNNLLSAISDLLNGILGGV